MCQPRARRPGGGSTRPWDLPRGCRTGAEGSLRSRAVSGRRDRFRLRGLLVGLVVTVWDRIAADLERWLVLGVLGVLARMSVLNVLAVLARMSVLTGLSVLVRMSVLTGLGEAGQPLGTCTRFRSGAT